ncbi:MAG: hypothetical protein ACO3UU_12010, partial [Minisyncoccia bacterium]
MHDIDLQLNYMLKGEFTKAWEISEKLQNLGQNNITDNSGKINTELWIRHQFNRSWFLLQQGDFQS